jgi:MFS family permease
MWPKLSRVSATIQRLRENEKLLVLCGATFLVMVGQGVVSPIIPLYAKDFGVSTSMVGLTITVYAAARLILNIPAGMIADRWGRRVLLIGGPILTSIGMTGSGFANDIWTLLVWRFVAGAGSAFYMSGALVYLIDVAKPEQRARFIATNQWALSLGVAIGPGIGGLIADAYGLSAPFHIVGVLGIGTAAYAVVRLPETLADQPSPTAAEGASDRDAVKALIFSKPFLALTLVTMTIFMTRAGTRGVLIPLHADSVLGWGPAEIGVLFTVTGGLTLFTLMPAAWASDHLGRRVVILFSGVTAGAGVLLLASDSAVIVFVIGNILMSFGTGTAGPAPSTFAADITPARIRGVGIGLYRSAGDIGFVAGPFLLGWLSDVTSITFALRVAGVAVAVAAMSFFWTMRKHPAARKQV